MKYHSAFAITVLFLSVCFEAGCGKQTTLNMDTSQPVTLTLYKYSVSLTDQEFQKFFVDPLKEKFPNVTLKMISGSANQNNPENLLASGQDVDLIYTSGVSISTFKQTGLPYPLNDLIKKSNLDLNRFQPTVVDSLKKYSDNGEIYGLPFTLNFAALFYNKDIFDKMGVPYPTDSMFWDDVLELSKKLTKLDGTTQYIGIVPPTPFQFGQQLSLPYVDKSTNQAVLGTPGWQQMIELHRSFFQIPGIVTMMGKSPRIQSHF